MRCVFVFLTVGLAQAMIFSGTARSQLPRSILASTDLRSRAKKRAPTSKMMHLHHDTPLFYHLPGN